MFDEYNVNAWRDGTKDGANADIDDVVAHLPGLDDCRDYTLDECKAAAASYVATLDFEDYADQYDAKECIPEVAFAHWRRGFESGLAHRLHDAMTARENERQDEIEYIERKWSADHSGDDDWWEAS